MGPKTVKRKLKQYSKILNDLNKGGIIRTYNSPIADYTEWLVAKKLNLTLENNNSAGCDAVDDKGLKYQIKGRWMHPGVRSWQQLGIIRDYGKYNIAYLVAVIFDNNFDVYKAYKIPYSIIGSSFPRNIYQNGIKVILTNKFLSNKSIIDITNLF